MNLYLRLIWILLIAPFKPRVSVLDTVETHHRIWPNDLDVFGHMNNSRYFAISDLARMEVLLRTGLWRKLKKRKLYPVIAGETVQFRKPLMPFQKYSILTKTIGWDEKFFYLEHTFQTEHAIHALMLVKVRAIGDHSPRIPPQRILEFAELQNVEAVHMDNVIEQWNESSHKHWIKAQKN